MPEIPRREHSIEVAQRETRPTMNEFADVLALPGFMVATDRDTYQSGAGFSTNSLPNFAGHVPS